MMKKILLVERLDWFSLTVSIIATFFGFKVYYLERANFFRNKKIESWLAGRGIEAIDFEKCRNVDVTIWDSDSKNLLDKAVNLFLAEADLESLLGRFFPGVSALGKKIEVVMYAWVYTDYRTLGKLFCWIDDQIPAGERVFLFARNNLFRKVMFRESEWNCVNLCPSWLSYISMGIRFGLTAVCLLFRLLIAKISLYVTKRRYPSSPNIELTEKKQDLDQYEILFFPHQSIFYGNLFLKDHFYSDDPDSPFHPTKILHVETNLNFSVPGFLERVEQYYHDHQIPYCFIPRPSFPDLIKDALWFYTEIIKHPRTFLSLKMYGKIVLLQFFLLMVVRYREHCRRLAPMQNAKIALAGFDLNFQPLLAMALESKGIRTVATQERFVTAFWNHSNFIIDTYLSSSTITGVRVRKKDYSYIREFFPVGQVRCDLIHRYQQNDDKLKFDEIRQKQKICLVFDYNSNPDEIANRTEPIINWRANKAFYEDLIKLADRFPQIYFVIRSKNDVWTKIPAFRDVIDEINRRSNIEANLDFSLNMAYRIAARADLVIAKHTSIANECQAAKIPVLFYDFMPNAEKMISLFFDYDGTPLFVYSYKELEDRVARYLESGDFLEPTIQEEFYYKYYDDLYDGKIRTRILDVLEKMYKNQLILFQT